jgi:hypothetical protein
MQVIKLTKEINRLKAGIIKQTEYFVSFLLYFTISENTISFIFYWASQEFT